LKPLTIDTCFSLELIQFKKWEPGGIVVVVDILRASSTICAALAAKAEKIYPVVSEEQAKQLKREGWLVAGERGGKKLEFADYGNSPVEMLHAELDGKSLVLTTSNGTKAIEKAENLGEVIIGGFTNLRLVSDYILERKKPVYIICSGWMGNFSYEDALFAGALAESVSLSKLFSSASDETLSAIELWRNAKNNLFDNVMLATHAQRLMNMGAEKDIRFALELNSAPVLPGLREKYLFNLLS
jgi:2-phosphosulfolactate phosphatase